ncbi:DNA polymerase Y family protein [Streptacidiphilus sp. PAMC 29251]
MAVVSGNTVVACSQAARRAGVRRRMRLRVAQARSTELMVLDRDIEAEIRAFEPVLRALEQDVAARLEVLRPGLVLLPARGPARYWGGEPALVDRLATAVTGLGHPVQAGVADTVLAAALAARTPGGLIVPPGASARFLAPYPVGVLGLPYLSDLLQRLGITTLGAFAALPADRVQARFGPEVVAAHRAARALEERPLDPRAHAEHAVSLDFEPPETRVDAMTFAGKALAERLHQDLAAAGLVCARVEVEVQLTDGRRLQRLWRHEGRLTTLAVAERIRGQLRAWADHGDLAAAGDGEAAGVTGLVLRPEQYSAATGRQAMLFGDHATPVDLEQAAARVQALLGHHGAVRVELGGGRSPGERERRIPFGDLADTTEPDGPWPGRLPAPHPAEIYTPPLPAQLQDAAGASVEVSARIALSAPPQRLAVTGHSAGKVTGWAGPWPVIEQWWDRDHGRRLARMQVTTRDGAWLIQTRDRHWSAEARYG